MRCLVTFGGSILTLQLTRSSTWQSNCSIEILGLTSLGDVLRADPVERNYNNSQMTSASPQFKASCGTGTRSWSAGVGSSTTHSWFQRLTDWLIDWLIDWGSYMRSRFYSVINFNSLLIWGILAGEVLSGRGFIRFPVSYSLSDWSDFRLRVHNAAFVTLYNDAPQMISFCWYGVVSMSELLCT